jgi:hypothetical protein
LLQSTEHNVGAFAQVRLRKIVLLSAVPFVQLFVGGIVTLRLPHFAKSGWRFNQNDEIND